MLAGGTARGISRRPEFESMDADGQEQPSHRIPSKRSFLRSSIVWKLTLFVGVLVTLNCGVLIGVAYVATSVILRDQIHERLSTVASDRQEMLAYTLEQQEERATRFASRGRIHQLMAQRAEGTISLNGFGPRPKRSLPVRESTRPVFWLSGSRMRPARCSLRVAPRTWLPAIPG